MLIDTHCHINMLVKKEFDEPLTKSEIQSALPIVQNAAEYGVTRIINVGTSLIESLNCIELAKISPALFAAVGIHPNDCMPDWRHDMKEITAMAHDHHELRIVAIGECGIDKHYPDYDMMRQYDAFRYQIELALKNDLALIVHSRDAADETLEVLDEYRNHGLRGVIHCFSYDFAFAKEAINFGFAIGLGGTITYPKNEELRDIATHVPLDKIILETDAPFLAPQAIRGKQNSPAQIATIANFLAGIRGESFEHVRDVTTRTANDIFKLNNW